MAKYLNPKVDLTFKKVFGEHPNLVKYKPKDRGSRAIKGLWLRFLTKIDENTKKADDVLLENPEIDGMSIELVAKYSGLTEDEISKI